MLTTDTYTLYSTVILQDRNGKVEYDLTPSSLRSRMNIFLKGFGTFLPFFILPKL